MFDNQKKSKSLTPIVVSNLSLLLGKTKILDKIKCKIHNESIVAVLGPVSYTHLTLPTNREV